MSKFFKLAGTNLVTDFFAGADPTGRATLEVSKKNTKHHLAHRISGDLGGFIAGSVATTALTSAGLVGAGKLFKGEIGEALVRAGKGSMILLKPKQATKSIKNFTEGMGLVKNELNLANKARTMQKEFPEVNKAFTALNSTNPIKDINIGSAMSGYDKAKKAAPQIKAFHSELNAHDAAVNAFKAKHGVDPIHASEAGATALAGVASAGIGGTLNALSSESQYSVGQDMRKLEQKAGANKKEDKKGKFFKKAAVNWKGIGKDFVGPGLAVGGLVGAGVTLYTKKPGDKMDAKTMAKGIGAGVVGDLVTGVGQGLWHERGEIMKGLKGIK